MPLTHQGDWKCQRRRKEAERRNFDHVILELQITLQVRDQLHHFTDERSKEMTY